jgi:hypothetical protein
MYLNTECIPSFFTCLWTLKDSFHGHVIWKRENSSFLGPEIKIKHKLCWRNSTALITDIQKGRKRDYPINVRGQPAMQAGMEASV